MKWKFLGGAKTEILAEIQQIQEIPQKYILKEPSEIYMDINIYALTPLP